MSEGRKHHRAGACNNFKVVLNIAIYLLVMKIIKLRRTLKKCATINANSQAANNYRDKKKRQYDMALSTMTIDISTY